MSRKRQEAARKPTPSGSESFVLPPEDRYRRNAPEPNKWFLAAAVLLETGWLTLLLFFALTG